MGVGPQGQQQRWHEGPRQDAAREHAAENHQQDHGEEIGEQLRAHRIAGRDEIRRQRQQREGDEAARPVRARPGVPRQAEGDGRHEHHINPESGAAAEAMDQAHDDLGEYLMVDPRQAGRGPREGFRGLKSAEVQHALAVEHVAPQIIVRGVFRKAPPTETQHGENKGPAQPGGRALSGQWRGRGHFLRQAAMNMPLALSSCGCRNS